LARYKAVFQVEYGRWTAQSKTQMTLAAHEVKLLERLKQEEKRWQWVRWAALLLGVGLMGLGLVFYRELWKELRQEELLLMLIALVAPVCCLFFLIGGVAASYAIVFWRGRPARKLLLRLIATSSE